MDEEDASGPPWKLSAQTSTQLPKNVHYQTSGYRLRGFDKPVHQHLYDHPSELTIDCAVRGSSITTPKNSFWRMPSPQVFAKCRCNGFELSRFVKGRVAEILSIDKQAASPSCLISFRDRWFDTAQGEG